MSIFTFIACNDDSELSNKSNRYDEIFSQNKSIYSQSTNKKSMIEIDVRNASYPLNDPGDNDLFKYYELRERKIQIPVNQAALILIDTWDIERKRFEESKAYYDIGKEIKPLLEMSRKINMLVLHAPHRPIGWDGINHLQKDIDLRGASDTPRLKIPEWVENKIDKDHWPPVEFIFRVGEYSIYSRYSNPLYIPYAKILGIHKDLLPKKRKKEFIESSLDKILKILKDNKILHLLYVGGATNQCIVQRPVGIRNMSALGYNTIIVRGATIGSELYSTYEPKKVTENAILDIEINNGFSVDKDNLLNAFHSITGTD